MRVLIVDDDPEIRATLGLIVRDEGYETDEAGDGAQALMRMRVATEPMLVLLDMWMPLMNGETTLLTALASPALWARLSFIVMTANPQLISPRMREILRLHAIPLLVKPFDIDPFHAVVNERASQLGAAPVAQRARRSGSLG